MKDWTEVDIASMFQKDKPLAGRLITSSFQTREASVLDIQRQELPADVWDKDGGKYVLNDAYRYNIMNRAFWFMRKALNVENVTFIKGIYLVSSIGTYFYSDTTDIDVKIVIDLDALHKEKPGLKHISEEVLFEYLVSKMRETPFMTKPLEGSERPFDWYVYEYVKFMDYRDRKAPRFDSIYDVMNAKWYKFTPKISDLGDTEIFKYAAELAKDILEGLDTKIGKLKRHAIDYDYFLSYLQAINPHSIDVKKELEKTITEIENLMDQISEEKSEFGELRRDAFDEEKVVDKYSKLYNSVNFSNDNLMRKIMEHYGYWIALVNLSKLWDDSEEEVKPKFVKELEELIKEL